MPWQCDLGNGEFDHDWQWISDWYGDPGVIGGTADCSYWECRVCGERDDKRPPPQPEPETWGPYTRKGDWFVLE